MQKRNSDSEQHPECFKEYTEDEIDKIIEDAYNDDSEYIEFKEASQKILSLESLDPLITVNALKKIQKLFIEYRTDAITVADPVIAEHKIKLVKGLKSKSYNSALLHIINKVFGVESFFFLKGSSISSFRILISARL